MRGGLGLIGLLVALALVAVLARQHGAQRVALPPPAADGAPAPSVRAQGQQLHQQVREQVESALQAPRALPED